MDTLSIGIITVTIAFIIGVAGCTLIERQVINHGAASVTMNDLGPKLLLRVCPSAFAASALVTIGAALAHA